MRRSSIKIFSGLFLVCTILVGLVAITHPIILKWATGSAKIVGSPIEAIIYTNGQQNNNVKIYKVHSHLRDKETSYYLLHFPYADSKETKEVISLNSSDNYVGRPAGTNKRDYDILFGQMFQSEVGAHFSKFQDDIKGYNFDPQLSFSGNQIKFSIPPTAKQFRCDSIRIEL